MGWMKLGYILAFFIAWHMWSNFICLEPRFLIPDSWLLILIQHAHFMWYLETNNIVKIRNWQLFILYLFLHQLWKIKATQFPLYRWANLIQAAALCLLQQDGLQVPDGGWDEWVIHVVHTKHAVESETFLCCYSRLNQFTVTFETISPWRAS